MPDSLRSVPTEQGAILFASDRVGADLAPRCFDESWWRSQGDVRVVGGGRGDVRFVAGSLGPAV